MSTLTAKTFPPRSGAEGTKSTQDALTPQNYAFLQHYIHSQSGIVIEAGKEYLIEARLGPLLRDNNLVSLNALSQRLYSRGTDPIGRLVIDAMTTNETLFFRDIATFDAMRTQIIGQLMQGKRKGKPLRIWSAASSTGQEAYSVAMMLLELGYNSTSVEIVGTDISDTVLERARQGKYVQFEVNRGLPAAYLVKYFTRVGLQWQIGEEVRRMVRFERLDLRQSFKPLGTFDMVLCRNVLIYFDNPTKTTILASIKGVLEPGGALVLGCAETIINLYDGFRRDAVGQTTFYRA